MKLSTVTYTHYVKETDSSESRVLQSFEPHGFMFGVVGNDMVDGIVSLKMIW